MTCFLRHAALDAVSRLASVHWIADQVRNDALLREKGYVKIMRA